MKADVYYFEQKGEHGPEWVIDVTRPGGDGEVLARYVFPFYDLMGNPFLDHKTAIFHAVDYHPEYAEIAPKDISAKMLFVNSKIGGSLWK